MLRRSLFLFGWLVVGLGQPANATTPEQQCLAVIAVLEAGGEGRQGMAAVLDVVRNRMADDRFPRDACAVIRQKGQFQPVGEWPKLARLLKEPKQLNARQLLGASQTLDAAFALLAAPKGQSPTGGALYFLNPRLMDKSYCPWFAKLKRTKRIGEHIFMTEYNPGEPKLGPALDCDDPMIGSGYGGSLANRYSNGLFHPSGPQVASKTPTRNQLKAWRQTGQLEQRQKDLKKFFKPGWISLD